MTEHVESSDLCGLEGREDEPPTRSEINRFVRIVNVYHGRPLKSDIRDIKTTLGNIHATMDNHMQSDALFYAKIKGAKWALWIVLGLLGAILTFLWKLLEALKIVGVL